MNKKIKEKELKIMKELLKDGKSVPQISKIIGFNTTSIYYNLFPDKREQYKIKQRKWFKNLSKERKQEIARKKKDYINEWIKNKYKNDEKFREKIKEYNKKRNQKLKEEKKNNDNNKNSK